MELQAEDGQAQKIKGEKLGGNCKDSDRILHHESLPYIPEIIKMKLSSRHYDDPLAGHFGIEKTQELVARKYFWETLYHNVKVYVRDYDVCLASKTVKHKPYENLQQLPVPTHYWKDFSMDFITWLPQSADWRSNSYDSILVMVNWLTKIIYYKPVQTTITAATLAKIILNVVIWYHGLPQSIISNCNLVFMFKFWSSLYYLLSIKRSLSIIFNPQTDG